MARTKTTPISTVPRSTRNPKAVAQKPAAADYFKKKNDELVVELKRRGVARPAQINKKNLVAALQQDDARAVGQPRRVETGAAVSKGSKGGAATRPAKIRIKPRTSLTRLQLLQETLLDIVGWVLDEDEDRLDPVVRALGRANVELDHVMAPYWRPSPADLPKRRTMSVGAPSQRLRFTGGARYGSVDFSTSSSPGRQGATSLNTRAASVGAEFVRTSPFLPPRSIDELDDEEGGELQEDEEEEQEVMEIASDEESNDASTIESR